MLEHGRGTFDLEEVERQRGELALRLRKGEGILVGDPSEGQYLRLELLESGPHYAKLRIFEKVDSEEHNIADKSIPLGKRFRLKGTKFTLGFERRQGDFLVVNAPRNVDFVRSELLTK
jgi:hypothetical protein